MMRAALLAVLLASEAGAQTVPPGIEPFVRNWTRVELWRFYEPNPAPAAGDGDTAHVGNRLFAGVRLRRGVVDATVAMQYVQFGGLPSDAIGPGALGTGGLYFDHAGRSDSSQIYLRSANVALRNLRGAWDVQVGRMGYTSGAERASGVPKIEAIKRMRIDSRLIGEFEWSLYQRAYDGVRVDWKRPAWTATGAALRPTQGGFEEASGVSIDDVHVVAGVVTAAPGLLAPRAEVQVFAYRYDDTRRVTPRPDTSGRAASGADIGITTVGGHVVAAQPMHGGELDLLAWAAVQAGRWYDEDHRGVGVSGEAGYQWTQARWTPWLRGGVLHTTGDDDAGDGTHETFFPMLPTVRRYSQSTLYSLANVQDVFVQVVVRPSASLTGRIDAHRVSLASARDGWYAGSGATQEEGRIFGYTLRPSGGETRVMDVVEASLDWRATPRWSVNGYVALASRGPVVRTAFADGPALFFYLENVVSVF